MEIKPPSNKFYSTVDRMISTTAQNNLTNLPPTDWKVSQLIQAIITKITDKQIFLDIQGIKANTPKPTTIDLHVGDTLKLVIEQLKPMPQFRVIRFQPKADVNIATQTLRNIISQPASITPLLENISYVANRPSLRPAPLSVETNIAVRELFKHLPSLINLKTSSQIKNQLQNSGLFVESKIKNQILSSIQNMQLNKLSSNKIKVNIKPLLELDLGAQLHRLANLIRSQISTTQQNISPPKPEVHHKPTAQQTNRAPSEQASLQNISQREEAMQTFLRQIESSLTHLQQTQLQNLTEQQAGRPLWLMELPIKNGQDIDLFELRISQEENASNKDEAEKIWNVTLKFNLSGLGKIKAHIKMQNQLISAQFYSEKPEVLNLFRENFDVLRSRLNCNGLNVGNIECAHASLTEDIHSHHSKSVDEKS